MAVMFEMPNLELIYKTYQGIIDLDQLEDRREYKADLLGEMYNLTHKEALILEELIQSHFYTFPTLYRSTWDTPEATKDAKELAGLITESIHQDFDGWEDWEKVTIIRYLTDLRRAMATIIK